MPACLCKLTLKWDSCGTDVLGSLRRENIVAAFGITGGIAGRQPTLRNATNTRVWV